MIQDATGTSDALRKFKQNESLFQRPVTVDWNNGRAGTYSVSQTGIFQGCIGHYLLLLVVGENESEILKLVKSLPKETGKVE